MATYFVHSTAGDKDVEAEDWKMESGFLVFFKKPTKVGVGIPEEYKVYAQKAELVYSIELKKED